MISNQVVLLFLLFGLNCQLTFALKKVEDNPDINPGETGFQTRKKIMIEK